MKQLRNFHGYTRAFTIGCVAAIGTVVVPVEAQQPSQAQLGAIRQACRSDYMAHCSSVPPGGAASLACLQQHAAQASPACQQALRAASGGSTAAQQGGATAQQGAPPAQQGATPAPSRVRTSPAQAAPQSPEATWPHTIAGDRGSAVVYQPQAISWPDRRTLNTRIALGITPTGAKSATLGTIEVSFATQSDLESRMVTLSSPKLTSVSFPTSSPEQTARFREGIGTALDNMGPKRIPLDMLLLSLRHLPEKPADVAIRNDPPALFYSSRPASLLVFDGEPVLAPVTGTSLSAAVNTNWDVFVDNATKSWYWLNNGAWLTAPDFRGNWSPVATLPAAFSQLPADANFGDVRKQIPGRRLSPAEMPTIFVSTVPAEIIVTSGTPQLVAIPGTSLRYVANTDASLFVDSATGRYYYLVSGRWFSAASLDGPWTFATTSLPPDFARIPPSSPRGSVLVSVPGTPQAQEALLQAQVPQQATLDRTTTKIEVVYSGGPPRFEPIPGTEMMYAANTMYDVIRVGDAYYACYQGAWFRAPAPTGAWVLADSVPQVIYTIPPSSPLYRCTYVRVYDASPTTVTYGYTAGYAMGYVSAGVVVYGTGYYYPPYVYPAPIPIYYPYPYTFSGATWYNSNTGAWARGGTDLRSVRRRCDGRNRLQPEHRRLGARRRGLRSQWRRGRVVGVQPVDRQLRARQRFMGHHQRHRERELVQRPQRHHRIDQPELQPVRQLGLEHVQRTQPDGEHAASERLARHGRQLPVEQRRGGRGCEGRRRQQRRRGFGAARAMRMGELALGYFSSKKTAPRRARRRVSVTRTRGSLSER